MMNESDADLIHSRLAVYHDQQDSVEVSFGQSLQASFQAFIQVVALSCWCGLTFISGERGDISPMPLLISLNLIQVMILMIRVIVKLPQAAMAYL
jgi:hypothetical protein